MIKAVMEFNFPKKERDVIYKSLIPDINDNERIKTKIINKDNLRIELDAKDVTALQANMNTLLRLVRASKDVMSD